MDQQVAPEVDTAAPGGCAVCCRLDNMKIQARLTAAAINLEWLAAAICTVLWAM